MGIKSKFRAERKRQPRHAAREELSATDVLKPVPDPDWATVPAAQVEAERASGPHPVLREFPPGARPAEDVPRFAPRGEHPYPQEPQPSYAPHAAPHGTHPFDAPLPQDERERRQYGSRHTQAYTPEFAETGQRPRPYAPQALPPVRPLPPATPMFFARDEDIRRRQVTAAKESVNRVRYPEPDAADQYGQAGTYAAMAWHYDRIFGTRTPSADPGGRWNDGRPAWLAPAAPEVPRRGLAVTTGDAA